MKKLERDQVLSAMNREERYEFGRILREVHSEAKAAGGAYSRKALLESRRSECPAEVLARLDAVLRRDQMGPKEGEIPPDFSLKRLGSEDRVQLSSFKGQRPVALVFGSYT